MLSNPEACPSGGNRFATGTLMCRMSRIALAYSVRLSRRMTVRPAKGDSFADASSSSTSPLRNASSVAASGRGAPAGGISPAPSLRMTRSPHVRLSRGVVRIDAVESQVAGRGIPGVASDAELLEECIRDPASRQTGWAQASGARPPVRHPRADALRAHWMRGVRPNARSDLVFGPATPCRQMPHHLNRTAETRRVSQQFSGSGF